MWYLQTRKAGFIAGCLITTLGVLLMMRFSVSEEPSQTPSSIDAIEGISPQNNVTSNKPPPDQNLSTPDSPAIDNISPSATPENIIKEETPIPKPQTLVTEERIKSEAESAQQTSALMDDSTMTPSPENQTSKVEIFWGPFLSQSRARKFADYIEKIINRPMTLTQDDKGYSIGFNYETEEEMLRIKQDIQSKAGIDLGI